MRALVQRVSEASVTVDGEIVGKTSAGFLVFLGVAAEDEEEDLEYLLKKIPALRVFNDDDGKMNRSLTDVGGQMLVVSQFTLLADTSQGNRPSFFKAAKPEKAEDFYKQFITRFKLNGVKVSAGVFGADMKVALVNDGPVTIWLDSRARS